MKYNEEVLNELESNDNEKNIPIFQTSSNNTQNSYVYSSSAQATVEMRQALIGSIFTLEQLGRLYEKTPVSDYFSQSSHSDSDFGVVRHINHEKKLIKRSYFIEKGKNSR